jgi:hypothetical protein
MEQWNLEGLTVTGLYLMEIPVKGKVQLSRVTYGGTIQHHIQLNEPTMVYGELRDRVILDHAYIESVR